MYILDDFPHVKRGMYMYGAAKGANRYTDDEVMSDWYTRVQYASCILFKNALLNAIDPSCFASIRIYRWTSKAGRGGAVKGFSIRLAVLVDIG